MMLIPSDQALGSRQPKLNRLWQKPACLKVTYRPLDLSDLKKSHSLTWQSSTYPETGGAS